MRKREEPIDPSAVSRLRVKGDVLDGGGVPEVSWPDAGEPGDGGVVWAVRSVPAAGEDTGRGVLTVDCEMTRW